MTGKTYSIDGVIYDSESQSLTYYPPERKDSVLVIPEGIKKIESAMKFPEELKEIHLPLSFRLLPEKFLTKQIEFYAKGNVMTYDETRNYLEGFLDLMEDEKYSRAKKPLHVTVDAIRLINYAYDHKKPIYISDGENIEYRPDGRPACRVLTKEIEGTDYLEVTGAMELRDTFEIPAEVDGKKVTQIKEGAFTQNHKLKKIMIPESVEKIGFGAFSYCDSLEEVTFLGKKCEIKGSVFKSCNKLKKVQLPEELAVVSDSLFYSCYRLKELFLPETVREIGENAFRECYALEQIDIPKNCLKVGSAAFMNSGIKELILPDSIRIIDSYTFRNCIALTEIELPKSLKYIGHTVFKNAYNLENVIGGSKVESVGEDAFENTPFLYDSKNEFVILGNVLLQYNGNSRKVEIPENVKVIASHAFTGYAGSYEINPWMIKDIKKGNQVLQEVVIGKNVCVIEKEAFLKCQNLSSVTLENPDIVIKEDAFKETKYNCGEETQTKCVRAGIVLEKSPVLTQVKEEIDFGKAIQNFERFVVRFGKENVSAYMLDDLYTCLQAGLQKRGVLSERKSSNWSAVATAAVFLSQFGYLTKKWYTLPDKAIMEHQVQSEHPILACYNYMRNHYYHKNAVKMKISENCVHHVTVVNPQIWKQAWQQPENYIENLYWECSLAKNDKERIAYNRLIGVLAELAEIEF